LSIWWSLVVVEVHSVVEAAVGLVDLGLVQVFL
jgi:hypothetical protein